MLKRLVNVVRNYPALSLAFAALFMIVSAANMVDTGRCLKTKEASNGIISLELAWDKSKAQRIVAEWSSGYCAGDVISFKAQTGIDPGALILNKAKENILLDFLFLVAYPLFFIVAILLLDPRSAYSMDVNTTSQIMIALAVSAGLLDAIENIFMYQFLLDNTGLHFLFTLPATIKFLFVLAVIVYIIVTFLRSIIVRK
ncbi:MAG TPA: hypothetical protein VGD65_14305 [Chryseosolibacter sp.]